MLSATTDRNTRNARLSAIRWLNGRSRMTDFRPRPDDGDGPAGDRPEGNEPEDADPEHPADGEPPLDDNENDEQRNDEPRDDEPADQQDGEPGDQQDVFLKPDELPDAPGTGDPFHPPAPDFAIGRYSYDSPPVDHPPDPIRPFINAGVPRKRRSDWPVMVLAIVVATLVLSAFCLAGFALYSKQNPFVR